MFSDTRQKVHLGDLKESGSWEIGVEVVPGGSWKSGKGVSFPSNSSSVVSVCLADE